MSPPETLNAGAARAAVEAPGPIFIAGRQHCGNTVLARILSHVPGCFTTTDENLFFEERAGCDRLEGDARLERTLELMRVPPEQREPVKVALGDPSASALDLYRRGMDALARREGKKFWVQKATSYVFYAEEILEALPDARIVYLVRDPYDMAASKKRRDAADDHLVGLALGWNRGYRIARDLEARFPVRFRILRYERMVSQPETALAELFEFLGLSFRPEFLAVRHLNRSEARYREEGPVTGLNASRVGYHVDVLNGAETRALGWLLDAGLVESHAQSTELPVRASSSWLAAASALTRHAFRFGRLHAERVLHAPRVTLARTWRRMRPGP